MRGSVEIPCDKSIPFRRFQCSKKAVYRLCELPGFEDSLRIGAARDALGQFIQHKIHF